MKRGRKRGHVRLLDNPHRFEMAAWLALTRQGMKPYPAAYLVTFLMSGGDITTESLDAALFQSTTTPALTATTIAGHADRLRRNAELAIDRANDLERAWLTYSAGLLFALIRAIAAGNADLATVTLDRLGETGWASALLWISSRIGASLKSNFPPAEGPLSRAAVRLLRELRTGRRRINCGWNSNSRSFRLWPIASILERPPWQKRS